MAALWNSFSDQSAVSLSLALCSLLFPAPVSCLPPPIPPLSSLPLFSVSLPSPSHFSTLQPFLPTNLVSTAASSTRCCYISLVSLCQPALLKVIGMSKVVKGANIGPQVATRASCTGLLSADSQREWNSVSVFPLRRYNGYSPSSVGRKGFTLIYNL